MEHEDAVPTALTVGLAELSAALDLSPEAAIGLDDAVRTFYRDAMLAVHPLIGMSVVYRLPSGDAVLSAFQPDAGPEDIVASLQIPAGTTAAGGVAPCLFVLYADQRGAFADLADGLSDLLDDASRPLLLVDRHLELPAGSDLSAFRQAALHEMAEGVLLGRGFSEIGASTFLEALTAASDGDAETAARQVIRSVR